MPIMSNVQYETLPPFMQQQYRNMADEAERIARQPFRDFPERRIERAPDDIVNAHNMARAGVGAERGLLGAGAEAVGRGMQPFTQHVQEYMNPYHQNVVRQIAEEGNRNFTENVLPALEARFVRLGQHGSAKHQQLSERAARDLQHEIMNRQQQALSSGYQQAGQMYNAQQARNMEAAGQFGNLAAAQQGSRLADIAALENQGRYQQQQGQANRDVMYQNFLREQEHPLHRAQFQSAMMQGMPAQGINQSYYQTPATPQMNVLGQLGPLAGNIWGTRMAAGR